jgi:hypothetical protein
LRSREIVNSRSSSLPPDARADRLRGRGDLGLGGVVENAVPRR